MTKLVTRRENLISHLIENINIAGIVTFITSMIIEEEYIISWLLTSKFLNRLIENFSPSYPNRHSYTASMFFIISSLPFSFHILVFFFPSSLSKFSSYLFFNFSLFILFFSPS